MKICFFPKFRLGYQFLFFTAEKENEQKIQGCSFYKNSKIVSFSKAWKLYQLLGTI
jgi:hypothetical protein